MNFPFFSDICVCEQPSYKRVEQITIQISRFEVLMSALIEIKAFWVRTLWKLMNSYRGFSSSLLLPSSGSVQSKLLYLNYVDPDVGASKHFFNVVNGPAADATDAPQA